MWSLVTLSVSRFYACESVESRFTVDQATFSKCVVVGLVSLSVLLWSLDYQVHGSNNEGRSVVWSEIDVSILSSGTWKKVMAGVKDKEEAYILPTGCTTDMKKGKQGDGSVPIQKAFRWLNITVLTILLWWLAFLTVHTFRPGKGKTWLDGGCDLKLTDVQPRGEKTPVIKAKRFSILLYLSLWKEAARRILEGDIVLCQSDQ